MSSESGAPEPKAGRLQNMALMEAVIAVCVLAADADDDVQVCEMSSISAAIATDPALGNVDMDKAEALLADYLRILGGTKPRPSGSCPTRSCGSSATRTARAA
jgi:tellurite resistance protein